MWNYAHTDELYHHGIKGQKWGVRRYQNADGSLTGAGKKRYGTNEKFEKFKEAGREWNAAGKEYRKANRDARIASRHAIGIKGIAKSREANERLDTARLNAIDAKAKYKAAKAKNAEKAEKAEFNTYRKEMSKTGIRGSALDNNSGGKSTSLYNHLAVKKGKAYADKVEKKVQNRAVTQFVTSTAVLAGAAAVSLYLELK